MPAFAPKDSSHPFARLDGVFDAVNSQRGLAARQADAAGFFPQHVNLLAGHGCSIRFQQAGKLVHDLLSTPRF